MNSWQKALINAVTDPKELFELLNLDKKFLPAAEAAAQLFGLKVPHSFIERMEKGNGQDPLLLQVLPLYAELKTTEGYENDPLQESKFNPIPGLLHKYHGRVLLTLTGNCGVNCRFCFRRHFPYAENNPGTAGWDKALAYIANDTTISEVILSGGDPLVVSDQMLKNIVEKIAKIAHVKRLRIHSRMPIVLPERITTDLINAITHSHLKTIFVIHCNHPQEINDEVNEAIQKLLRARITLLNQSVLLKKINDDAETLAQLSEALFACGVLPYYLHLLDKVQGTAHFDIEPEQALHIHQHLTQRLSGFLVPKLVYEQPGALAKKGLVDPIIFAQT